MGRLSFTYGIMGAGKTTLAIQNIFNLRDRCNKRVLVVKPGLDTKGGDKLSSRHMGEVDVDVLLGKEENLIDKCDISKIDYIVVDEAQFLSRKQVIELETISQKEKQIGILTFGLQSDFKGDLFEGSKALMVMAHDKTELHTVCEICGKTAMFNARKANGKYVYEGERVVIDGARANKIKYTYGALCCTHYYKKVLSQDQDVKYVVNKLKSISKKKK